MYRRPSTWATPSWTLTRVDVYGWIRRYPLSTERVRDLISGFLFFFWNCHLWILGTFGFDTQTKEKETTRHRRTTLDLDETSRTGVGSYNMVKWPIGREGNGMEQIKSGHNDRFIGFLASTGIYGCGLKDIHGYKGLFEKPRVWYNLIWHGLSNYSLTIHLFYVIIIMLINLELLDSVFDYKSIRIKFVP